MALSNVPRMTASSPARRIDLVAIVGAQTSESIGRGERDPLTASR